MRPGVSRGSNVPRSGLAHRVRAPYENARDTATRYMADVELLYPQFNGNGKPCCLF